VEGIPVVEVIDSLVQRHVRNTCGGGGGGGGESALGGGTPRSAFVGKFNSPKPGRQKFVLCVLLEAHIE
jgi:hypothetical protein